MSPAIHAPWEDGSSRHWASTTLITSRTRIAIRCSSVPASTRSPLVHGPDGLRPRLFPGPQRSSRP
jgi:hypothetical protein